MLSGLLFGLVFSMFLCFSRKMLGLFALDFELAMGGRSFVGHESCVRCIHPLLLVFVVFLLVEPSRRVEGVESEKEKRQR